MKIEQRRTTAELSLLDTQTLAWRTIPIFPWSKLLAEHIVLMMSFETEHRFAKTSGPALKKTGQPFFRSCVVLFLNNLFHTPFLRQFLRNLKNLVSRINTGNLMFLSADAKC